MINKKKVSLLFLSIMIILMFSSCINAEFIDQTEVKPVSVTLSYEDRTATQYEGDRGLRNLTFTDELSGKQFSVYTKDMIRTLAYLTKKTLKFNDSIVVNYGSYDNETYYVTKLHYKNGTYMSELSASRSDLSPEEKSYFDNYEDEREEYLAKLSSEDSSSTYTTHSDHKKSGIVVGTRGIGYYRSL